MATRLYSIGVGQRLEDVQIHTGSAVIYEPIELTVDVATSVVPFNGSTRAVNTSEILQALEILKQKIISDFGLPNPQ